MGNIAMMTVAEYFAGIGLIRLGLQDAGWRVVFANDISPKKYAMYRAAFPDVEEHFLLSNIFDVDAAQVPSTTLATCSFPCIDLSLAGKQAGLVNGRHSNAFWGFIDILRTQDNDAPETVMLENVSGWLSSNNGLDFRLTIQALNNLGYACDVFTLDALRFVPQSRPRVFVIGTRRRNIGLGTNGLVGRSRMLISPRLNEAIQANSDLNWVWLPLPEPPPLLTSGLSNIVEQVEEDDPRWWSDQEVARHLDMMAPSHRAKIEHLASGIWPNYRTMYRRMRSAHQRAEVRNDDVSGCLRTAGGGSARQMLVRAGGGRIRMRHMTSREYARLQGAPDSYPIEVPEVEALTGFGDAVCVPLVSWIAQNVLTQIARVEVDA